MFDDALQVIHEPARLRLMALLYRHREVGFASARDALGLTDGNLATHARRLEAAGYIEARRVLQRQGFQLRYRITHDGADAFRRYLASLRAFIEAADPLA